MKWLLAVLLAATPLLAQQNVVCPYNTTLPSAVTASTLVFAPAAGKTIRLCKVVFNVVQGTSPISFSLVQGTGGTCGTNTIPMTQAFSGVPSATQTYDQSVDGSIVWSAAFNASVCLILSGPPTSANIQIFFGLY